MDLGSQQRDNRAEFFWIIARVLSARGVVARVPELRVKRLLGRTKRNVRVAPQRIDANRILGGGVRSRPDGVNQVRDHGTLSDQLRRLLRDAGPFLFTGAGRRSRRLIGL